VTTGENIKFPGGTQDKGLNNFEPAIGASITWANDSVNVSGGMRRGASPRYGFAPLGGHSNIEVPAANQTNGIMRSENAALGSTGYVNRKYIFGVIPVTMTPYDGVYPKANKQYYVYIVGAKSTTVGVPDYFDACLGSTLESSVNKQASTLAAGLAQSSYIGESPLVRLHKTELANLPVDSAAVVTSVVGQLQLIDNKWFMPISHISVSGKRIPYFWMFAKATSTPATTTAPNLNLWSKQVSVGNNPTILGGSPSEMITREFKGNNQRLITIHCLDDDGLLMSTGMTYTKQITQANTASVPAYGSGNNYLDLTGATRTGSSTAYASVQAAVINDPGSYTNSRHDAILIAGEAPFAVIYQDWMQAVKGMMPRWVDLTNPGCIPRVGVSPNVIPSYSANIFPANKADETSSFINVTPVSVANAKTGFLKKSRSYDIGFSYYNKLIDYETNVVYGCTQIVDPAVLATVEDFGILLEVLTTVNRQNVFTNVINNTQTMPWEYSNVAASTAGGSLSGRGMHINDYELRFYYRDSGIGEWLPAGNYDAAQYFFAPFSPTMSILGAPVPGYAPVICQGAVGSEVGGQPNGFNDYSPLPKQRYICSAIFQQRAFWFSDSSIHFSYQNNIYAYATRNTLVLDGSKCKGGIVHIRTNDSQQQGRIIVFAGSAYAGRFTGERALRDVRVSSVEVGQLEVDGSDFVLDYLCDSTAFSYRAAVVAEGVLYFWGPQGIYRDDGTGIPRKVSLILESDVFEENIFNWVDMGRDQEVHCVYNNRTHEVCWFYPPKTTDATFPTYGLTLNVENGAFYHYKFRCQVDSSQNIEVENDETPDLVDGNRVLLHCRATAAGTVQRTFFFDEVAKAGEQGPSRELSVISFISPTTDTRRLTLAAGSVGITAGSIAVNDYLSFQNTKGYAPSLTNAADMIAKITAIDNAASTIDILLPTGASFDAAATLTGQTAFPIYHRGLVTPGLHGISYLLNTNYWLPGGLSMAWYWQYFHFLFKYIGIPTPKDPFNPTESVISRINFAYECLRGDSASSILSLVNNSKGHCQILHQLSNSERSANGQALTFSLSGIHIGDPWTLEYLEAQCLPETGYTPKEFEA